MIAGYGQDTVVSLSRSDDLFTYDIRPEGDRSRITYTDTILRVSYVPYWLQPWMRPITRGAILKGDTKQLTNLARLAEERHAGVA